MVTVITPSRDTDIVVLLIALLWQYRDRVYVVDGTGEGEKRYGLWELHVDNEEEAEALLGFHAFTGYYSSGGLFRFMIRGYIGTRILIFMAHL